MMVVQRAPQKCALNSQKMAIFSRRAGTVFAIECCCDRRGQRPMVWGKHGNQSHANVRGIIFGEKIVVCAPASGRVGPGDGLYEVPILLIKSQ